LYACLSYRSPDPPPLPSFPTRRSSDLVAAVTTKLNVGTLVYGVDYRHPVVYARQSATLQAMSGGRHEFGIGAGWMADDYQRAGRSEEHTSELQSLTNIVCRLLLENKNT